MMNIEERKNTKEPINMKNSLECISSSLWMVGMFLSLEKNNTNAGKVNANTKMPIMILMAFPASVKA